MIFPRVHPTHPPAYVEGIPQTQYQQSYNQPSMQHQMPDAHMKVHFDRLHSHSSIFQGNALVSENGAYYATVRDDGQLYVYVSNHFVNQNIVWCSQSQVKGHGPYRLQMQDDGNLVIYDKNDTPIWASDTYQKGPGPYRLVMQSDGNLVMFNMINDIMWSTNTSRK